MDVIDPHLETIGAAISVAARRRTDRYQRRSRRVTMVALAAPFLLGGGSALAGVAGVGPLADQLAVFNSSSTPAEATVPASVTEIAHQEGSDLPGGASPDIASARQIAHVPNRPATLHAMRAGARVCLTLTGGTGSIGHCIATLSANNEMEAALGIVDGQAYVWGAVANDVTKITITTASGEIDAILGANGFVAPVSQAQAQCSITVTATALSGNTTTTLKPVPAVAVRTSAPGKNDVQSGRVTDATC
jgi:hypothetical protein